MKHEASEHHQMQSDKGCRKSPIITYQISEARGPKKGAFHDPASWQLDEATLGLGQCDDFQLNPMLPGLLSRGDTSVALVYDSTFDRLASHLLPSALQFTSLSTSLLVGWRHQQSQQIAQRTAGHIDCTTFASLHFTIAGTTAAFRYYSKANNTRYTFYSVIIEMLRKAAPTIIYAPFYCWLSITYTTKR